MEPKINWVTGLIEVPKKDGITSVYALFDRYGRYVIEGDDDGCSFFEKTERGIEEVQIQNDVEVFRKVVTRDRVERAVLACIRERGY